MGFATGTGQCLGFQGQRGQIVAHAARGRFHIQTFFELRILGRHANRAAARVAVMAETGTGSQGFVVFFIQGRITVERHERRHADGYRIRAERQGLCHVGARPNTTGNDQLHFPVHVHILQRLDG